ncbi:MAG: ABC transporter permease [Lachnospiraceae bacterium]|nr:ABC transporter permease [Lachnospiraceae bacterium]
MLFENCKLALLSIKANKLRSFLTMLGIIIGVASVIAIMTLGNSLTKSVMDQLQSYGAKNISVGIEQIDWNAELSEAEYEQMKIKPETIKKVAEQFPERIEAISVEGNVGDGTVRNKNKTAEVSLNGVSAGYFVVQKTKLEAGNFFSQYAYEKGLHTAIVSSKMLRKLYGDDYDVANATGKEIEINLNDEYIDFTIVGVYKPDDTDNEFYGYSGSQTSEIYIPLATAWNISHDKSVYYFTVLAKEGENATELGNDIQAYLTGEISAQLGDKFLVSCYSNESMIKEASNEMKTMTLAVALIAAIALIVGGIGVMNIMTVSITERTKEIGTRKALGAQDSMILFQFISEAIIICLIGGIIGIGFGLVIGSLGTHALGYSTEISISSIYISVLFSMAIGVIFGYSPAKHAAKMNPIDALRYE